MSFFFIAELCQNHNGNIDNLYKLVDAAAEAGATHIKIQHIYTKSLVFRPQFESGLIVEGNTLCIKRPWQPEFTRLKSLELPPHVCDKFVDYVLNIGLIPMTTCFTRGDVQNVYDQGFRLVKVASYDCASYPLLRELSSKFDQLLVSTGATFDDEIIYTSQLLNSLEVDYSFLHCITQYPTPLSSMNLKRIEFLKQYSRKVGFSDHSLVSRDQLLAAKASILFGASFVERHFTISNPDLTKDGPVSITPHHVRELLEFSLLSPEDQILSLDASYPEWRIMAGDPSRRLSSEELLNRDYYRGRFATPRYSDSHLSSEMIHNFDEVSL